jgi:hypothetical protein
MKRLLLAIAAAYPLGAQSSVPVWSLSSRPSLDIGSEANTQTQFNGVTGILRMPGGDIVVANGTSQELRVFSSSGLYLRTLTAGDRSVAMRSLAGIWRGKADTVYAAEVLSNESNLWTFALSGFVSKAQVGASNAGGVYPIDRFPDGTLVVSAAPRKSAQAPTGMRYIDEAPLGIMAFPDRVPKWIGSLRNEMVMQIQRGRGAGRAPVPYPLGRSTSYAVSNGRLWIGDSETGTITVHDATGRGLAVFSAPIAARALDTAAVRRMRSASMSDAMNWYDRTQVDASYSGPLPQNAPRFGHFVPGTNGEMWVELFRENPSAPRTYVVLDRSGAAIGRAMMPRRMVPLEIGPSDLMGVLTDDEGLEHVVRYSFRRPP